MGKRLDGFQHRPVRKPGNPIAPQAERRNASRARKDQLRPVRDHVKPGTAADLCCHVVKSKIFLKRCDGISSCPAGSSRAREYAPDEINMDESHEHGHSSTDCGQQSYHAPTYRRSVHPTCIIHWALAATYDPERSPAQTGGEAGRPRFRR